MYNISNLLILFVVTHLVTPRLPTEFLALDIYTKSHMLIDYDGPMWTQRSPLAMTLPKSVTGHCMSLLPGLCSLIVHLLIPETEAASLEMGSALVL